MPSEKYFLAAVINVEYVFGKVLSKFTAKVCYCSKLWLLSKYGCDWIDQVGWSPMATRTYW